MFKDGPYRPSNAYFMKNIHAKASETHGVGVFSEKPIKAKEIFEVAPVLIFTPYVFNLFQQETEARHVHENYVFWWGPGEIATAWGYVSLYNHANGDGANAKYRLRKTDFPAIEIYASRDIEPGEEIFLHYMHGRFDLEFDKSGDWWNAAESDMTLSSSGFANSAAALMSDAKKHYR